METKKCQVLVIGAGPGGYVAAIRAGQLGLSTIIVEGEKAGGTCLIRGCIPSKALIHAAHRFHDLAKHAKDDGHMGISIPGPAELNMADLVGWKENIVTRLNKGVEHLLKNAGAELITGWAEFQDAKTVKIGEGKGGTSGKQVLYQAFDDLPQWVTTVPKIGFKLGDTLADSAECRSLLGGAGLGENGVVDMGQVSVMEKWQLTMLTLFAQMNDCAVQ